MKKIILDLCGGSGMWSNPYKKAGYDVRIITLPENDILTYSPPKNVYGILAAPPCEEFSIAKNSNLPKDFKKGMETVNACLKIIEICKPKFYALENPIGYLQNFLGKPNFIFQPWEFGNPWTKKTGIWGNFNLPKKKYNNWDEVIKIKELYIRPGRKKPSIAFLHKSAKQYIPEFKNTNCKTDADFRALTPQGFAKAFFRVNQ